MSQFDFWQRWGAELDATEFANAWAALGVVGHREQGSPRELLEHRIRAARDKFVPWRFPQDSGLLHGTMPREWADAWRQVVGNQKVLLTIVEHPRDESVLPWLQLLEQAQPPVVVFMMPSPTEAPPEVDPPPKSAPSLTGAVFEWLRERFKAKPLARPDRPTSTGTAPPASQPPARPSPQPLPESVPPPGPRPIPIPQTSAPDPVGSEPAIESTGTHAIIEARFLQQRSFVRRDGEYREAAQGFIAGVPARVTVRIGAPDESWNSLPSEFPVQSLPQNLQKWALDVWLTEPEYLHEPLLRHVELPRHGDSSEAVFEFTPLGTGVEFEGRITVLHRGRVIQTAVLRASVQADAPELKPGRAARLENLILVRHSIADLAHRRRFDLAFVLNHTSNGQPRAVALADKHAWIASLREAAAVATEISGLLAPVAKSAVDYADGITGEKGRALLVKLARAGVLLRRYLVRDQLSAPGNQPAIAKEEYVQVVSTNHDAVIPFEFIYDFDAPETTAVLCEKWKKAIDKGELPDECTRHTRGEICPTGFWGLRKVIERHQVSPELAATGRALFLQSEPSESRAELELDGISVFGASKRVPEPAVKSLAKAIRKATGKDASLAKNWDEWVKAVERSHPKLLIALAHSDGRGTNAGLEIGGVALEDVMVTSSHILGAEGDPSPLVALLGCDTVNTTEIYGNHARTFRGEGAAIVIATISTVLGEHAASVAESLVAGLLAKGGKAPTRVGETLRAIKRQALLDKQMMPLCLVAYGDADWQIKRN